MKHLRQLTFVILQYIFESSKVTHALATLDRKYIDEALNFRKLQKNFT